MEALLIFFIKNYSPNATIRPTIWKYLFCLLTFSRVTSSSIKYFWSRVKVFYQILNDSSILNENFSTCTIHYSKPQ